VKVGAVIFGFNGTVRFASTISLSLVPIPKEAISTGMTREVGRVTGAIDTAHQGDYLLCRLKRAAHRLANLPMITMRSIPITGITIVLAGQTSPSIGRNVARSSTALIDIASPPLNSQYG
jgi:hypothetical protein